MQRRTLLTAAGYTTAWSTLGIMSLGTAQAQVTDLNDAINKAGRQRMLSQRMAKFCLSAMLGVDTSTATTEIAKARDEFISATELLRNAPQATDRIRQELLLADGQWVFFYAALQRLGTSNNTFRQVSEVFVSSENLLASMDRVTGLYAALGSS